MIVCHCNVITAADIRGVVQDLLAADRYRVVTPGLVYMTLSKRGRCCGCFPNAIDIINNEVARILERPVPAEFDTAERWDGDVAAA